MTAVAAGSPAAAAAVGGRGAGPQAAANPTAAGANVSTLPNTGVNENIKNSLTAVAVIAGLIAVSQLGLSAYRRFAFAQ